MLSRILGYVRDALVAATFGGGHETDAFYAAFKIPNLFRRFLGEGSLTAAFVPVFSETLEKKGKEEAKKLFSSLLSGLLIVLFLIVALGILFAAPITQLVSWGFTRDPEKFALTVELTRLTFPFLLIICVAALVTAVLNSCGKFFTPALAPSGLSIGEIAFILLFASLFESPIHGLAISAIVGVGIHLFWQLPGLLKEGYSLKLSKPFSHPEVKTVFVLMLPTLLGLCADQVNSFVDQLCASFLREGSVTALYNANRVMQLPLALFGIAVASVSLPALSKSAGQENIHEFKSLLSFSLRIANFVLIPSVIGLVVLGYPIVQTLFQHGKFTEDYSRLTFWALLPYSLGLPAYSAIKILASAFYAKKNTKTPVKVALWAMGLHVVMNLILMWPLGVAGLALATAASAWFQAILLFFYLRKDLGVLGGREIMSSFLFGSTAGVAMGVLCYILNGYLLVNLPVLLRVFLSIGGGAFFYFWVAKKLKIPEYGHFLGIVTKRKIAA